MLTPACPSRGSDTPVLISFKPGIAKETEIRVVCSPSEQESVRSESTAHLGRIRPALLKTSTTECCFVLSILLSMMMSEYCVSGFNVVLPSIAEAMDMPDSSRAWPSAVINLTTASLLLPFARLCDMYGCRFIFLFGHTWLFIWSIASGFSCNNTVLTVCRAMQGIGPAASLPSGMALLSQTYQPGPRKNIIFTLYGAFASVGFYAGLVAGAMAAEHLNWRWYFWIGAAIGPFICAFGLAGIPTFKVTFVADMRMDWWGCCTLVPGLVLTGLAFGSAGQADSGWATPYIYVSFVLGALFLVSAVYVQGWVSEQPLLPPELFQVTYMKRLFAALFCLYGAFGVFLYYVTFHIQTVIGMGPVLTAVWFAPLAAGGILLAVAGGWILHVVPGRPLMVTSCLGFILAMVLFLLIPQQDRSAVTGPIYWPYVFPAMIGGTVGVDIAFNVSNVFITTKLPQRLQATAGGVVSSLFSLGMTFWLGVANLGISMTAKGAGEPPRMGRYKVAFWIGLCLAVVALCLTISIRMGRALAEKTINEEEGENRSPTTTTPDETHVHAGPGEIAM